MKRELWDGHTCGVERACELTGADEAMDIKALGRYVSRLRGPIYASAGTDSTILQGKKSFLK